MSPVPMVSWARPLLTVAAFAEFIAAGRKVQKSLLAKPVETITQETLALGCVGAKRYPLRFCLHCNRVPRVVSTTTAALLP